MSICRQTRWPSLILIIAGTRVAVDAGVQRFARARYVPYKLPAIAVEAVRTDAKATNISTDVRPPSIEIEDGTTGYRNDHWSSPN